MVQERSAAADSGERLAAFRYVDDTGDDLAGLLGGDADRPVRQPVQIVDRAVDRIDDPAHRGGGSGRGRLARLTAAGTGTAGIGAAAAFLTTLLAKESVAGPR